MYVGLNVHVSKECRSEREYVCSAQHKNSRHKSSTKMIASLAAMALLAHVCAAAPNIVFVLLDDVGVADVGFSNEGTPYHSNIPTPFMDVRTSN